MFADCIKQRIHPATWAILGVTNTPQGAAMRHRGTAFAVDAQGHLVTCWHVLFRDNTLATECDSFIAVQPDRGGVQHVAVVVGKEKDRDIALLKIDGKVKTQPVKLYDGAVPSGTSCGGFGHPLSAVNTSTNNIRIFSRACAGIVSMAYTSPRFAETRLIQLYELDFFAHGGASGGPNFMRNGDVFALVSGSTLIDDGAGRKVQSNLSVSIDSREVIEFLKPFGVNADIRRGRS